MALSGHVCKCYDSLNDTDREPDLLLNLQKRHHAHLVKKIRAASALHVVQCMLVTCPGGRKKETIFLVPQRK